MGCGESKHAVATADTVSQSKRSNSKKATNGASIEKATEDVKTNTEQQAPLEEEQKKGGNANEIASFPENDKNDIPEAANVKESENPKTEDVKESDDHQENAETVVETVKENENKEAADDQVVVAEDAKNESETKEMKEELAEETKKEESGAVPDVDSPKKEGGLTENEGNQTEEVEVAVKAAETEEEKAPVAKEENATESSDPKTN
ncbi:hypothetical protein ACH5RR_033435 [Cinchona calisaya]|uniref:Uncharacterized protein n=1 Tax=Cinchona calisaya TaxID=153742 RepID=A0ABD2YR93_9GENT